MKINISVVGSDQQKEYNPNYRIFTLKVMIQKSIRKLLHAQTKEDFVEFLFSLLFIPLGVVEQLLAGKTTCLAINNLHRSTAEFMDNEYFKSSDMKNRLMVPNLVHGCISKNHILPLTKEGLPVTIVVISHYFLLISFHKVRGCILKRPRSYKVKDDLTVEAYCFVSILSSLKEQKIMISDVEEVEMKIGPKEALSILKASVTSTSALFDALLNHTSIKQPKREL